LQGKQLPHEVTAGTSTLSPSFRLLTAEPVSTTVPTASCPRTRPLGHRWDIAFKDVQIRAAAGRHVHLHDHFRRLLDTGIVDCVPRSLARYPGVARASAIKDLSRNAPASRSDKTSNREPESDRRGDSELDCGDGY
jgi:hypothetical protein